MSVQRALARPVSLSAFILVAGLPTPLSADELVLEHPAEICIERAVDAELGAVGVDLILAAAGLAEPPTDLAAGFVAIGERCVSLHGVPSSNGRMVGGLVMARAMRNEARRRLQSQGVDIVWLDKAVDEVKPQTAGDLERASEAVFALMRRRPPEGIALDVEDGTEASRLTGALVHAYVSSVLQAENWSRLIRG